MTSTLHQFGAAVDKRLNQISERIGVAVVKIAEATRDKDAAWEEATSIFQEFDQIVPRFIAKDGHYLSWQSRRSTPKLNAEKLYQLMIDKFGENRAKNIWWRITVRTVDSRLLEIAAQRNHEMAQLIDQALTVPPDSKARVREEWTAEDRNRAEIFGLTQA